MAAFQKLILLHIGESFDSLCKIGDLFGVAPFNCVSDAVVDVTLQNDLTCLVQRRFCGVYLRKNILAGNVLVYHAVNGIYLTDYFFQPSVQIICVHTFLHSRFLSRQLIF